MMDTVLDGTPEDCPHREEAMRNYRMLWAAYLWTKNPDDRSQLGQAMDAEQLRIAVGPGPLWSAFEDSLPGYRAWWARERNAHQSAISF